MKNQVFLIMALTILLSLHITSQVTQEWVRIYNGGSPYDGLSGLAIDGLGNSFVTGYSQPVTGDDYVTIKYNSAGVQQWLSVFDGSAWDYGVSVGLDGSGNAYVTGRSGYPNVNIATIKYNNSGAQQWVQIYDGPIDGEDRPNAMKVDNSGNVYITGQSGSFGTGFDYLTLKYNSSGVQQWVQRYNGPANAEDVAVSIAVDESGNVYVTGRSAASGSCFDYATIKYNSAGVQQWVQRYNGEANSCDLAKSITADASGNVYVTGQSGGNGTSYDYVTIKYNSSGAQQWVQRYNSSGSNDDIANSISIDGQGNVFVTGTRYTTIKYNPSGVQQWVQNHGTLAANSIITDGSGNCYVTGEGFITIKYNPSGIQQWIQIYSGNNSYSAIAVAGDNAGDIFVAGTGFTSSPNPDYYTIKYSQMVGITPISNEIPKEFNLSQNYPNPFNPSTKIKFDIPSIGTHNSAFVQIKVFDILGREVAALVNEQLSPGTYEVEWDATNYPSGVYYYKLLSGDYSDTKKMILVK